jgi:CheY-like chemotaxis protein
MKKEVVEHIFDPYFTTKKKGQGTGFGLSIVRNIIQKHGGMVCVESEEGQGTTFSIYLPLVLKSDTDKTKESKKMLPTGSGHLLLVDDDTTLLEMGKQMLESFGFTVETTDSGKKAIALFKKNPIKFDALLTDYSMPTTPGNEVIRKCKKIDPDLPTFLLSGRLHEIEDSDFEDLGKISFVPKPVNWRRFSRMLQQAIDQQRS